MANHRTKKNHLLEDLERGADYARLPSVQGGLRGQHQLFGGIFVQRMLAGALSGSLRNGQRGDTDDKEAGWGGVRRDGVGWGGVG